MQIILNAIKKRVKLERLYLFGSHAKGNPTADSDLDLCIIAETGQSRIVALRDIRTALFAKAEYPLDFVFLPPTNSTAVPRYAIVLSGRLSIKVRWFMDNLDNPLPPNYADWINRIT